MVGRIETEGVGSFGWCARNSDDSTGRAVGVCKRYWFIGDKRTRAFCFNGNVAHLYAFPNAAPFTISHLEVGQRFVRLIATDKSFCSVFNVATLLSNDFGVHMCHGCEGVGVVRVKCQNQI